MTRWRWDDTRGWDDIYIGLNNGAINKIRGGFSEVSGKEDCSFCEYDYNCRFECDKY